MEELSEKNLYKRMPGFAGLRDETDPLKAETEAIRATMSGASSPAPQVNGPQRVTGESVDLDTFFSLHLDASGAVGARKCDEGRFSSFVALIS